MVHDAIASNSRDGHMHHLGLTPLPHACATGERKNWPTPHAHIRLFLCYKTGSRRGLKPKRRCGWLRPTQAHSPICFLRCLCSRPSQALPQGFGNCEVHQLCRPIEVRAYCMAGEPCESVKVGPARGQRPNASLYFGKGAVEWLKSHIAACGPEKYACSDACGNVTSALCLCARLCHIDVPSRR